MAPGVERTGLLRSTMTASAHLCSPHGRAGVERNPSGPLSGPTASGSLLLMPLVLAHFPPGGLLVAQLGSD